MKIIVLLALLSLSADAGAAQEDIGLSAHDMFDMRTALGFSAQINHRLLVNMRSQMLAVQAIIGMLAAGKFDQAAKTAGNKLGMNEEMRQIYARSRNEDFKKLGLAFSAHADELNAALQTRDLQHSLRTLSSMMGYCSQCHSKFRQ